jgi:hypothetical protein
VAKPSNTTKDLMRYDVKRFELIPLHRPKAMLTMPNGVKKSIGKAPLHAKWTTKTYDSASVRKAAIAEERNVGVRLTDEQLVIDVDPRNGGEQGFQNLCHDIGIDGDKYPRVITGSGGWHCYMSKPADILVRDTLDAEEYAGVEFKSKGRQVVAAGSIHPNGKPYVWSPDHPGIEDGLPKIPNRLLNIIKRPPRSEVNGGGQYTPEQIAKALSKLDVDDFDTNDKWLPLMQACHHASAGDARQEFVDWSTSSPAFAKDAYIIGKRWDSLHADRNDGVTYRTLNKLLRDRGESSAMAAAEVPDDEFGDDPEDDTGDDWLDGLEDEPTSYGSKTKKAKRQKISPEFAMFEGGDDEEDDGVRPEAAQGWPEESVQALEAMNAKYVALLEGGKFRIMYKERDPELDRDHWLQCDKHSFETMYSNRKIERDMTGLSRNAMSTMPIGEAWIQWPRRKTVKGIIFEPDSKRGERDEYLNLWSGWGMEPDTTRKGSWKYMRELISDILADGNEVLDSYIMNWLALMFQKPSFVPGTALVFRGGQGVGKGTLGNALCKMIGTHAMAIGNSEHMTGRFNSHFRNCLFLFADEATSPYDRSGEARLRHLITEPTIGIERKGVDLLHARNMLHVAMASNEQWIIPAGPDERRFVVNDVNKKWQRKQDKWDALHAELEANGNGGYRTMMADLMMHEIPDDWNVRDIPITKALTDQKVYSMKPLRKFWHDLLDKQSIDFATPADSNWAAGPITFFLTDFRDSFAVYCRNNDIKAGGAGRSTMMLLKAELRELFPTANVELRLDVPEDLMESIGAGSDGKAMACRLPNLSTCAEQFEKSAGLPKGTLRIKPDHGFG